MRWLLRFRKLDMSLKDQRQALVDTFINAIYLYDDKVLITFNYKEGTQTVTFGEATEVASEGNGSDLDCFTAPENAVKSKDFMAFCFSGRVCTLLHISCTLYKKAMNSLHRLHSVYFAAQKREFYAKSTRVSSRRSSASICRMASRIILPVIFVATGVLFSGGSCGFAPATSCV